MVLQHCSNIKEFYGYNTRITGKFLSYRSFVDQSAHESFREKSYVALLFVELPPDFTQFLFFVQVTSLFSSTRPWPRLSTSATPTSLVSFSRIVLFADQSAHESFRENSSGDIAVLANCKSLSVFDADWCRGITGKFLSDRSFRGPVRSQIVPRKIPGDIVVLQHCPNIKECRGSNTGITGKFLSDRSFADQSAHESFREKSR